jgi:hypothetical protein
MIGINKFFLIRQTFYKEKRPEFPVVLVVPGTGIEPALPCGNQILSLARLPIPPSGHFVIGVANVPG